MALLLQTTSKLQGRQKTSAVLQLVLEEQNKLTDAHQRDADERRILLLQIKELQKLSSSIR